MTMTREVMPVNPDQPGTTQRAAAPTVTPVNTGSDLPTGAASTASSRFAGLANLVNPCERQPSSLGDRTERSPFGVGLADRCVAVAQGRRRLGGGSAYGLELRAPSLLPGVPVIEAHIGAPPTGRAAQREVNAGHLAPRVQLRLAGEELVECAVEAADDPGAVTHHYGVVLELLGVLDLLEDGLVSGHLGDSLGSGELHGRSVAGYTTSVKGTTQDFTTWPKGERP